MPECVCGGVGGGGGAGWKVRQRAPASSAPLGLDWRWGLGWVTR